MIGGRVNGVQIGLQRLTLERSVLLEHLRQLGRLANRSGLDRRHATQAADHLSYLVGMAVALATVVPEIVRVNLTVEILYQEAVLGILNDPSILERENPIQTADDLL